MHNSFDTEPNGKKHNVMYPHPGVLLLLAAFIFQCLWFIKSNSVTVDEEVHVPVGIAYLKSGLYQIDHGGNPPLARKILALPAIAAGAKLDLSLSTENPPGHYETAWLFLRANYDSYHRMISFSRLASVAAGTVLFIVSCFTAARLYGPAASLCCAALLAFSPNVIAHSSLATLDIFAALFLFTACLSFAWFLKRPGFVRAASTGILTGVAMSVKYTNAIAIPIILFFLAANLASSAISRRRNRLHGAGSHNRMSPMFICASGFVIALAAIVTIWAGYGFRDILQPIGSIPFRSRAFIEFSRIAGDIPSLLPAWYLRGIDTQLFVMQFKYHTYYMLGELSKDGWSGYFALNWLVKETVGSILLLFIAIATIFRRGPRPAEYLLLIPAVSVLLFYSFVSKVDLGFRYLLPAVPFTYIFASRTLSGISFERNKVPAAILVFLIGFHCFSSVRGAPYQLSYFNEIASGPAGGHRWFLESNYDWGQNLIALKKYMDREGIDRIHLANYGLVPPSVYGISADWLPCDPDEGIIAVSPNYIHDIQPFGERPPDCFSRLRGREPDARAGNSLFIFYLEK